ncbi:hypothetical protein BaRGS_00032505 [Batillaria attramentaria]|uniref:Ion transport domain-containing protein n=1 Tax=Batillaria attramentaria TaxID=370345 RepID=A0ABD0JN36_9CAEN
MASAGATVAITVDDVTVESTATEEGEGRPAGHGVTGQEVSSADPTNRVHSTDAPKTPQSTNVLHPNGPSTSGLAPSPSPRRQNSRNGSSQKDTTPPLDQRSLLLAATLVLDAKSGRNLTFRTEEEYIRSYINYHKVYLRYGLYFFILLDLALALFEKPALPGASVPYWGTMLIEVVCIAFFILRVLHAMKFQEPKIFWKDTKNYMVIGTIVLTVIDMIAYIVWINVAPDTHPVRWSRPLRVLFIINFSDGKQIRRAFRNIRRTVPDILNVLILFMLSVCLFALLAFKLFYKRPNLIYANGDPYFKSYGDAVWDLYVLVTTANNPDVMMPAYNYTAWYAIFFIIYLVICLYIFMSIVLAAIYNNYKKNLKNEVKSAVYSKRQKLIKAFGIVKVDMNGKEAVTPNRWKQLMSVVLPTKSAEQIDLLNKVLDTNGDSYIYRAEFLNLSDLLHVELTEVKDRQTLLEKLMPTIYRSTCSNFLQMIVRHKIFRYAFDLLIFANAFFIGFDVDSADWFFLTIFSLEILLKLYVFGPKQFFQRLWNMFDFFVIGGAVIASLVEFIIGDTISEEFNMLDTLLVLRVLRLFKLFGSIKRFKIVIQTIVNIGPSIVTYGGVIFVFYYFFAIIGMEIFQGLIKDFGYNENDTDVSHLWCGNPKLKDTTFYRLKYCKNNFDDIIKAFVLMFELSVVNQWHDILGGVF